MVDQNMFDKKMHDKKMLDGPRHFLANNFLTMTHGMNLNDWLYLLRKRRCEIEPRYWPRVLFITAMSALMSVASKIEEKLYSESVMATQIQPPIFILGHWRSGTTLLHNLLACDPQFAAPTLFQTLYPSSFLILEKPLWPFGALAPKTRLIDKIRFGFDQPQEDEFALCNMTQLSPYMTWIFPQSRDIYDRYLTLEHISPQEYDRWGQALIFFLRKVTLQAGRRLILKSPAHTARIRTLLKLFPEAQFVHISRNPYAVFQSTKHLYQTMFRTTSLQTTDNLDLDEMVLRRYEIVYERFHAEHSMIPAGRYCELHYEELDADPIRAVKKIYSELGLQGFDKAHPHLLSHIAAIGNYQKNKFRQLPMALQDKISQRWFRSFDEWGYEQSYA